MTCKGRPKGNGHEIRHTNSKYQTQHLRPDLAQAVPSSFAGPESATWLGMDHKSAKGRLQSRLQPDDNLILEPVKKAAPLRSGEKAVGVSRQHRAEFPGLNDAEVGNRPSMHPAPQLCSRLTPMRPYPMIFSGSFV